MNPVVIAVLALVVLPILAAWILIFEKKSESRRISRGSVSSITPPFS